MKNTIHCIAAFLLCLASVSRVAAGESVVQTFGPGPGDSWLLSFTGRAEWIWHVDSAAAPGGDWALRADAVLDPAPHGGTFLIPIDPRKRAEFYRVVGRPDPGLVGFLALSGFPGGTYAVGRSINDDGLVAGYADTSELEQDARSVLWEPARKEPIDLGTAPPERQSWAMSINAQGVIVGYIDVGDHYGFPRYAAFVHENGVKQRLPKFGGGTAEVQKSVAYAINDLDEIAGQGRVSTWGDFHAALWTRRGNGGWNLPQDLGTLPGGSNAKAQAISASGEYLAGDSNTSAASSGPWYATRWQRQGDGWIVIPIDRLGSWNGYATSVNDFGTVVGYSDAVQGLYVAFVWTEQGGTVNLGTLGGEQSLAWKVTNGGLILGQAQDAGGDWQGCLWEWIDGAWMILEARPVGEAPEGSRVTGLFDMNGSGWMTGTGILADGSSVAVLLQRTGPDHP